MSQELWSAVDRYLEELLVPSDAALDQALEASTRAGLPAIHIAPNQGKLLHLLARAIVARTILEVGTLGGYSTLWLARALPPEGRIVTLEAEARHAEVARANFERAGVAGKVDLRLGRAAETLAQLVAERALFDLVFIDADKPGTTGYFERALELTHPGSVIVVDNVIRKGEVASPGSADPAVQGMRRFAERLAREPRVIATALQTVGVKGHDGFAIALVTGRDS